MKIEKKVKNNPIVMGDIKAIKGWIVGEEKGVPNYDKNSLVLHKKQFFIYEELLWKINFNDDKYHQMIENNNYGNIGTAMVHNIVILLLLCCYQIKS